MSLYLCLQHDHDFINKNYYKAIDDITLGTSSFTRRRLSADDGQVGFVKKQSRTMKVKTVAFTLLVFCTLVDVDPHLLPLRSAFLYEPHSIYCHVRRGVEQEQ